MVVTRKIFIDGQTGEVFCKQCRKREKPPMPMAMTEFTKWINGFAAQHINCEAKPGASDIGRQEVVQ